MSKMIGVVIMITSKQRASLRAEANSLDAILQIGKGGISENLLKQLDDALEAREMIKIRVLETSLLSAKEACRLICENIDAEPVQCIGTKIVLFRRNKKNPKFGL